MVQIVVIFFGRKSSATASYGTTYAPTNRFEFLSDSWTNGGCMKELTSYHSIVLYILALYSWICAKKICVLQLARPCLNSFLKTKNRVSRNLALGACWSRTNDSFRRCFYFQTQRPVLGQLHPSRPPGLRRRPPVQRQRHPNLAHTVGRAQNVAGRTLRIQRFGLGTGPHQAGLSGQRLPKDVSTGTHR